jgi:hypothetical protein
LDDWPIIEGGAVQQHNLVEGCLSALSFILLAGLEKVVCDGSLKVDAEPPKAYL